MPDAAWARILLRARNLVSEDDDDQPDFIGQQAIKRQVDPFLKSPEPFPNTLILGEPGIGKTRLARWIAYQRGETFTELLCPVNPSDIDTQVVLLDECHQQRKPEPLFEIMENDHVTVLGATTRPAQLDPAFRSRFFLELHLRPYPLNEMQEMIQYLAEDDISDEDVMVFASAAAGNPRQAERIMATAKRMGTFDPSRVLATCRITADGLTEMHLKYLGKLNTLKRPVGLNQLATLLYSDEQTLRNLERVLTEYGLIELTSGGRLLSSAGRKYLREMGKISD